MRWLFCNYDDASVGFPRDCGPTSLVTNQWNSIATDIYPENHGCVSSSICGSCSETIKDGKAVNFYMELMKSDLPLYVTTWDQVVKLYDGGSSIIEIHGDITVTSTLTLTRDVVLTGNCEPGPCTLTRSGAGRHFLLGTCVANSCAVGFKSLHFTNGFSASSGGWGAGEHWFFPTNVVLSSVVYYFRIGHLLICSAVSETM